MRRRDLLGLAAVTTMGVSVPAAPVAATPIESGAIDHDVVVALARALAAAPYRAPTPNLPRALRELDYDGWRQIRFVEARSLWRDDNLPFRMQLFHRGFLYEQAVEVAEIVDGRVQAIPYEPSLFQAPAGRLPSDAGDLRFAGFRLLHPLNRHDHYDEVVAFLGASYFRALGRGHVYGISARGLAIGTASQQGEEFPRFRSFWIERPRPHARHVVVHALLDSPSVTGAYRFTIHPAASTLIDVACTLFPRSALTTIGIAPGTSMFLHGPNARQPVDDFRPSVHDSDGLFMLNGAGEELWRPLSNPRSLQVSAFADRGPRGFGLLQRQRDFSAFHDLEAQYHRRPGLWVEPVGDWGPGSVVLVEIPTDQEIHDNIVAFWRPQNPIPAGDPFRLAYRLSWTSASPGDPALARFEGPRIGAGADRRARRFVLDALGGRVAAPGQALPQAEITASHGTIRNLDVRRNDVRGGVRVAFELLAETAPLVELRGVLRDAHGAASETWLYRWTA